MPVASGEINGLAQGQFALKDVTVENLRPLRVVVIGAGFSGILAAIRIPEKLRNVELTVYEKNEGIGGVWFLNKYPGLACDIPSHSYQYTFEPNPYWSNLYAPGPEIRQYLESVAEKYGATRFIKTSHQVEKCVWNSETKKWTVTVLNVRERARFEDVADFVVTARGTLNDVFWPSVPGLKNFQGKLMHSAEWDTEYDCSGKRIGVIGNGSSSIQIVPSVQKLPGTHVTTIIRSPTWISGGFGDIAMMQLGRDPNQTHFTESERKSFANDPEKYFRFRKVIESGGNMIHESTIPGTKMQQEGEAVFTEGMRNRLKTKPEIFEAIKPTFAPGCRRLTPGIGYLEALCAENVEVVTGQQIAAVKGNHVVLEPSGREIELDVLVCATGFQVAAPPNFEVIGRDGQTLAQRWGSRPESYLSLAVDGFPNYMMMFGPNSAIGFGSLTKILEAECDYIVKVLRKVQKEDYATIEPKPERVKDFTQFVGAYFKRTVYLDKCKSWYRSEGGIGDWISGLWPGSTLHALEALRSPRWEDFILESADASGNALRWLGNGWSTTQLDGDPSWYINPDEVDWPKEGRPEDAAKYTARPWSY